MKVVVPRRKKSQWNPGGLRNGYSEPCAIRDWRESVSTQVTGSSGRTETFASK